MSGLLTRLVTRKATSPAGETREVGVAGLPECPPDSSRRCGQDPKEQPEAYEAELRAESQEIIVWVHAALPQGA